MLHAPHSLIIGSTLGYAIGNGGNQAGPLNFPCPLICQIHIGSRPMRNKAAIRGQTHLKIAAQRPISRNFFLELCVAAATVEQKQAQRYYFKRCFHYNDRTTLLPDTHAPYVLTAPRPPSTLSHQPSTDLSKISHQCITKLAIP
jgi:hypothetical protein